MFGTRQGLLVLKQNQQHYCISMSFTVPSGCYALVNHHQSFLDYMDEDGDTHALWPAGLHFPYPPWVGVSHLITKRSTIFHLIVEDCRTKDDITVDIKVVLTFRIMGDPDLGEDTNLVRKFVYELTPYGLERQFRDTIGEVVQDSVRLINHTEVYGIRSGIHDVKDADESAFDLMSLTRARMNDNKAGVTVDALNARFNPQGVEILSVTINHVHRNPTDSREDEIISLSANYEELILQNADVVRSICMEDEIQTMMQKTRENQLLEYQATQLRINMHKVQLNDEMCKVKKSATEVREESRVRIQNISARKEYEIQQIKDKAASDTAALEMKAKLCIVEQIADAKKKNVLNLAEASLKAAKVEADVCRVLSAAEGETACWKTKRKDFITDLKKIKVYKKLAGNEDLILNSSSDKSTDLLAVADRIIEEGNAKSNEHSPTSVAVAERALLKQVESRGEF